MSIHDRAAQFSPFAALVGYGDEVKEVERTTEKKRELTDDEIKILNLNLNEIIENINKKPQIKIVYYVPDKKKSGGKYITKIAKLRFYDLAERKFVFYDNEQILIDDIKSVEIISENK